MSAGAEPLRLPRLRRSARVLLFNASGELFLIRFQANIDGKPFIFWVTPGGEVEPGEDDRAAAERELFEELGLRMPLFGPVHQESGGTYFHLGETVRSFDVFFAARCEREAPVLTGVNDDEIALMREGRWWPTAEIEVAEQKIYPVKLAQIARKVKAALSKEVGLFESDL